MASIPAAVPETATKLGFPRRPLQSPVIAPYDIVVIGGGAAGLSGALVLSRARRSVLVVDAGLPRNAPAAHMQGFLSRDGLPPTALLTAGREEIVGYGGEIADDAVSAVVPGESGFEVVLAGGRRIAARRLL